LIRLLSFSVSFVVTMTLVATLVARVVSYETDVQEPSAPTLIERGHDETLVQRAGGGIETDGSRAPGPRHRTAQAHLR
jgi:hypothetical protein